MPDIARPPAFSDGELARFPLRPARPAAPGIRAYTARLDRVRIGIGQHEFERAGQWIGLGQFSVFSAGAARKGGAPVGRTAPAAASSWRKYSPPSRSRSAPAHRRPQPDDGGKETRSPGPWGDEAGCRTPRPNRADSHARDIGGRWYRALPPTRRRSVWLIAVRYLWCRHRPGLRGQKGPKCRVPRSRRGGLSSSL